MIKIALSGVATRQQNLVGVKIFWPKSFSGKNKYFGSKNIWEVKKKFLLKIFLGPLKLLGCLVQNILGSKILLGSNFFLLWFLATITWPNRWHLDMRYDSESYHLNTT